MKIFLLANNSVGLAIAKFLRDQEEEIVGLGIHESKKQKHTREIVEVSGVSQDNIFFATQLRDQEILKKIKLLEPDIIISAFWGYILKKSLLVIPPKGAINLHPGYLPFNRGLNPNVWPFIEGTPAGVTIHYIDDGIDTGDVIARRKIRITPIDTAETLYNKTLQLIVELFVSTWDEIRLGTNKRIPQSTIQEKPTFHSQKDIDMLDKIDLTAKKTADEWIRFLRSRTYSDRYYTFYFDKKEKIYVRIQLSKTKITP